MTCSFHDPEKWGPHVWYMMDLMIVRLDPGDQILKEHILMQLISLLETIPCPDCRLHYRTYFEQTPSVFDCLSSKESLAQWIYQLRVSVQHKLGKPSISFETYCDSLWNTFGCRIGPRLS